MSDMTHTPGPWVASEYGECEGYDCMTGGMRVGPVVLDGADYGQERCRPISPESLAQMEADARLIAAAPDLLKNLVVAYHYMADIQNQWPGRHSREGQQKLCNMRDSIAKAIGMSEEDVANGHAADAMAHGTA